MTGLDTLEREPVAPGPTEAPVIKRLAEALQGTEVGQAALVGPHSEKLPVPASVYTLLRRLVHELAAGAAVAVVPYDALLTTQQAADFLNVSRPYLVKLLNQDPPTLPHRMVGKHRRIAFRDVLAYRQREDQRREEVLARMVRKAGEAGLYDHPEAHPSDFAGGEALRRT